MKRTGILISCLIVMVLAGCTNSITDKATEKRIKLIEKADPSWSKIKVETDGMVAEVGYTHYHPFALGNQQESWGFMVKR
ncbi:MAG: lepB [Cohnella sp.]|nr:lepB [Cohnella sp.]